MSPPIARSRCSATYTGSARRALKKGPRSAFWGLQPRSWRPRPAPGTGEELKKRVCLRPGRATIGPHGRATESGQVKWDMSVNMRNANEESSMKKPAPDLSGSDHAVRLHDLLALAGRVTAEGTGAGVHGVSVEVCRVIAGHRCRLASGLTDATGRFQLLVPAAANRGADEPGQRVHIELRDRNGMVVHSALLQTGANAKREVGGWQIALPETALSVHTATPLSWGPPPTTSSFRRLPARGHRSGSEPRDSGDDRSRRVVERRQRSRQTRRWVQFCPTGTNF
jgi:hypothetical protein